MKYTISEFRSPKKLRGYAVFGQRFATHAEAVAFAEAAVARREAAAGRELSRQELETGIATEDRSLRERIAVVNQNQHGYGGTAPKPAAMNGPANPNAVVWAQDALEKAQFTGTVSDVIAARDALARVKAGGDPIAPHHVYMLPTDRIDQMRDGRGHSEIVVLRKSGEHHAIVHRWEAESAPDAIKTLSEKENASV